MEQKRITAEAILASLYGKLAEVEAISGLLARQEPTVPDSEELVLLANQELENAVLVAASFFQHGPAGMHAMMVHLLVGEVKRSLTSTNPEDMTDELVKKYETLYSVLRGSVHGFRKLLLMRADAHNEASAEEAAEAPPADDFVYDGEDDVKAFSEMASLEKEP